jgi:hypothetical protein
MGSMLTLLTYIPSALRQKCQIMLIHLFTEMTFKVKMYAYCFHILKQCKHTLVFCANLSLQIILRRLAVRQARVQISARHPG